MSVTRIAALSAMLVVTAAAALAQQPGQSRIQLRPLLEKEAPLERPKEALIDYREKMRLVVQTISTFAHGQRPNFLIITRNNLDLLSKADPTDPEKSYPARTYMQFQSRYGFAILIVLIALPFLTGGEFGILFDIMSPIINVLARLFAGIDQNVFS